MIKLNVEVKDNLVVSANIVEYDKAPYLYIDVLNISKYKIVDAEGKTIDEGSVKSTSAFENGTVAFEIPLDDITSGTYKLIINEFVGSAKAEQDLLIKGTWECSFVK